MAYGLLRFKKKVVPLQTSLSSLERTASDAVSTAGSEHEEAKHVRKQDEHLTAGKTAFWDVVELYRRMFLVIGVLLCLNLVYYAVWAYCVPNFFCQQAIKNAKGTNKSFLDCVYVTDGDYSKRPKSSIPLLIFYIGQWTWQTIVPYWFGAALFGVGSFAWYETAITLAVNLTVALTTAIGTTVKHWAINKPILQLFLPVSLGYIPVYFSGRACARFTKNPVNVARWFMTLTSIGVVAIFYAFAMPRLVTTRATPSQKLLVRLIIHPSIWIVMTMYVRHVGRHIGIVPGMAQTVFLVYPYMYKAMYGRFLLLQLSNGSGIIMLNFLVCMMDLIGRLATRNADMMLLRLIYGRRVAQAMLATEEVSQWRAAEILARSFAEYTSIIAGGALFSFGHIAAEHGVSPNIKMNWGIAAAQGLTFLFSDFVGICVERKYHQFNFAKHMPKRPTRILIFLFITQLLGSTRLCIELILLFCPRYYDGKGVLLEICNQSSVFDHLRAWRPGGNGL